MNTLTTNIKIARLLRNALVLFLIFVRMYSYGQLVVTNDCSNISSPTTIDLTKHVVDSHPAGTTLTWHTATPATSSNKYLGDPTKAPTSSAGIDYYAAYEDVTPGTPCYSPTSGAIRAVLVSCSGIPVSNVCPTTFVDLTSHVTGTAPAGTTLVWIKGLPLNISNKVSNPSQVAENGDYYATYYDASNNCFSPVGAPISVTINSCGNITISNVCPSALVDLTSHASPLTSADGAPLKWFTSSTPSVTNMVTDPTAVSTSGTYYPAYYDAVNNCFSPSGAGVVVTISTCCPILTNTINNNVNPSTCGASDGSIKICGLPANSSGWTINYDKNGVSASSLISQTSDASGCIIISGLTAGIYTNIKASSVTCVNGSNGIDVTLTDPIAPEAPLSANASPSSICSGGSTTLSATCSTGTMSWYTDAVLTTVVSNIVSPTVTTTYYGACVTGTCKSSAVSIIVNVNPLITLTSSNFTKTNPTSCAGTEGTIKLCGLDANTSYVVVYNKNGASQTPVTSSSDANGCLMLSTLTAGTYDNFIITNSTTTCSIDVLTSVSMILSDPTSTTITLGASQNPSVCGLNDGFIQIDGLTPGTQYIVNYLQNGIQQTTGLFTASSSIYTLTDLTAANYTNIVATNNSCISNTLSKALSDPITAIISLGTKTDPTTCSGNDGTFTISGLAPNTEYVLYYSKDGFVQTPISFTSIGTSYQVAGLLSGTYSNIRVTNSGCTSNSLSVTLSDPGGSVISMTSNNPSTCKGSDGSITITGLIPGTTYEIKYKKDGIWQTSINHNATGGSYTINGLTAGAYSNITASNGGCMSNSLSQILVDPEPAVIGFGTITQPTFCGANNGSIIITGLTSGLSYILNYVKDGVQQASTTFIASGTSFTLSGLVAANYTGINVNQAGCISNTLNTSLSNPGGAIIDVVGIDPISCLPGNEGKLLVTGLAQGLNYILNYTKNGISQTPIPFNATTTSYIVDGLTAAAYSNITVMQASCVSNAVNVTLLSPSLLAKPTLSLSALNTNCSIGTADLTEIKASNLPAGTILEWHTATPATAGNKVADPTVVGGGTYYAVFYNGTTKCYSETTPVNVIKVPCAIPDYASLTVGTSKIIQVLANDKNPDGTSAVLTEVTKPLVTTAPNKGTVNVNPDGTITYTPNANASGTDTFIYQICDKANPTVCDTALVTVNINCIKPVLTIENILCAGTGSYSVTFSSDGAVTSDQGTIVGTTVTNIPVGVKVRLTSTSNCGETSALEVNSPTCPPLVTCTTPVSLSVGQPVCTGNGTYLVAYSISNGTLSVSFGTINQKSNSGTTSSGTITVSSLVNIIITGNPLSGSTCTSQEITVIAPLDCQTPSCEDGDKGLSYSTVCNGNGSFNINIATVPETTVTSSTGSFVNLTGAVSLTITEKGCVPRVIEVTAPACIVNTDAKLQAKVFLQGAFFSPSTGTEAFMRDDLRSLGIIPTIEPYTAMNNSRFNKVSDTGGQTIGSGVLDVTGVNAIVDWVFVELRDATNPATVLKTRAALVQRDGDVVEANDGMTPVTFIGAAGTSYYVSIKHRNHLGAMTATPIMLTTTGTLVDFTSMTAAQLWDKGVVLGDNSLGSYNGSEEVLLDNGKMGLWAGNAINTDIKVKYSGVNPDPTMILNQVLNHQGNSSKNYNYDFATPVYQVGDINMDGKVKYQGKSTDAAFILFNIINKFPNNFINKTYNFDFMVEQIP
ncbi:Ig-like domain-containing protein [Emticicia sp. SJ17W-69]|uniref:Ig-like domain-containing protein n=1 Tax=Emticicia sp. SJ17W-69 TaxID=3421657 RepID=UPI003EBFAC6B